VVARATIRETCDAIYSGPQKAAPGKLIEGFSGLNNQIESRSGHHLLRC